ncbi:MAG: tetratricopeptide repeat protein [Verrucomicrobiota bacterium]
MTPEPAETVHLTPLEIWYMYKTKILTYAGIIIAALVIYAAYQLHDYLRTTGSQELYAKAQSVADFEAVLKQYPGTVAAGDAALRMGEKLRTEKKYDESAAVLRNFVEKYPTHPLAAGGWTGLAATYEMQGKLDEALAANTSALSKFPDAYTAPIAMMSQARIYKLKGDKEGARRAYENVANRYRGTLYAREAMQELHLLKR